MPRVILAIIALAFSVWCVVDVVQTPDDAVRGLPKPLWVIVTLAFPLAGGLAWLIAGRPRTAPAPRGPLGPDDDPDFLKDL